ncbi:MAG: hemerythrin domain-containing protein [Trebonia sp.]
MARLTPQRPAPSTQVRGLPAQSTGQPYDIVELVMADHRRIRHLARAVDDAARYTAGPDWVLAVAWQRLAALLQVHTRAEEEVCYLPMFGSAGLTAGRMREAVSCHEDMRDAISEASLQCAGSPPWWCAVQAVLAASAEHLDHEEYVIQSSWMPRLTMSRRWELGRQWSAFAAAWRQDAPSVRHSASGRDDPAGA